MLFTISSCTEPDFPGLFSVISNSFGHTQPIVDAFFPKHDTPAGTTYGISQLLNQHKTNPNVRFVKAVDSDSGEIAGVAKWLILDKEVEVGETDDAGGLRGTEEERAYVKELLEQYYKSRSQVVREIGKIVVLDILAVHPKWQERGAGTLLVKWGLDLADEMGLEAIVESTVKGRNVYEKSGFSVVKRMDFQLKGKFPSRAEPHLYFLHRSVDLDDSSSTRISN